MCKTCLNLVSLVDQPVRDCFQVQVVTETTIFLCAFVPADQTNASKNRRNSAPNLRVHNVSSNRPSRSNSMPDKTRNTQKSSDHQTYFRASEMKRSAQGHTSSRSRSIVEFINNTIPFPEICFHKQGIRHPNPSVKAASAMPPKFSTPQ